MPVQSGNQAVRDVKGNLPKLCNYCQGIMNHCPEGGGYLKKLTFKHHLTSHALAASATAGCILCIHLTRSERDGDEWDDTTGLQAVTAILETTRGAKPSRGDDFGDSRIILSILRPGKHAIISMLPTFLSPTIHTPLPLALASTESSLPLCKTWLNRCLMLHEGCKSSQSHRTPTRLLFIDDGHTRLRLSHELDGCPEYATLSHCWGSLSFLTLNKSNITKFQEKVPVQALTKTFQDAIRITSYLGLQYLWIDSLCIIQDDIDDWHRESPLMSDVYGGSTINIAASSAPDGSHGCFFDRHMFWGHTIQNEYYGRQSLARTVYYQCIPDDFEEYLLAQPLFGRAWVQQERLLSKRILHFTRNEVFWECEGIVRCETFPDRIPSRFEDAISHLGIQQINSFSGWSTFINAYSTCNLTLARDKLAAISGVARIVQHTLKDKYVAGLWKGEIISQLRWDVAAGKGQRITPYVAPTWSWASVTGNIEFPSLDYDESHGTELEDVDIEYATDDPFGQVTAATLRLRCKLIIKVIVPLPFSKPHETIELPETSDLPVRLNARLDVAGGAEVGDGLLYLLRLLPGQSRSQFTGLILKATEVKRGQYQRIGTFFTLGYQLSFVQEALENPAIQVSEADCISLQVEEDGSEIYIIDIV
ncbi:heterokaryon incompatibility protein-domain-containing protein [Cadophora sp. MPI-SDFR-AT-0126]|nr:heterokaryon incompatibility protein-domain-containing protein [Leotiomycetes sp. MPI-SDFR-AT-0126]